MSDYWQREYERDGVALIPHVFSKNEMDQLRALAWLSFRSADHSEIQWKGRFPALLFSPRHTGGFRVSERLQEIVRPILGNDVLQLNNQVYFRLPGDNDQFAWHQDVTFRTPKENFQSIETGYLQTAIIIDDIDLRNSPIEFVLGSHKEGDLGLIPRDDSEKGLRHFNPKSFSGKKMTARSGDILIWSVMTVHGSGPNNSNRPRMYYMNGFAREECVKSNIYPQYLKNGKLVG